MKSAGKYLWASILYFSIALTSLYSVRKDSSMITDVNITPLNGGGCNVANGNANTEGQGHGGVDQVIEISLLKITKIQGLQMRDERPRLLVTETLQKAMAEKIVSYRKEEDAECDNVTAYARILQGAIQRLGLNRSIKITLEMPEDPADYPKIRIPLIGRKMAKETLTS